MNIENGDNTISEIHRIRREIAAKFKGDLFAITADAQARTEASGRQIIRKPKPTNQPLHRSGETKVAQIETQPPTT